MSTPLERLRYHVTGAIERGEKEAIVEQAQTCEDRNYKCCEQMSLKDHEAAFGYQPASNTQLEAEQPTPTPWIVVDEDSNSVSDDEGVCYVIAKDIALIATLNPTIDDAPARANAELIVEAVNSYSAVKGLVEALENARQTIHTEIWNKRVSGRQRERFDALNERITAALHNYQVSREGK